MSTATARTRPAPTAAAPLGITITEAARRFSVSRDTIYREIRNGELDAIRIGARTLVLLDSMDRYIERHRIEPVRGYRVDNRPNLVDKSR
jgi:excisionase family DNA binding protein